MRLRLLPVRPAGKFGPLRKRLDFELGQSRRKTPHPAQAGGTSGFPSAHPAALLRYLKTRALLLALPVLSVPRQLEAGDAGRDVPCGSHFLLLSPRPCGSAGQTLVGWTAEPHNGRCFLSVPDQKRGTSSSRRRCIRSSSHRSARLL